VNTVVDNCKQLFPHSYGFQHKNERIYNLIWSKTTLFGGFLSLSSLLQSSLCSNCHPPLTIEPTTRGGTKLNSNLSRRSVLAGTAATTVQLLFSSKLRAASALSSIESEQLAAAPGLIDLTLTALSANTLRIGIAPANAQAPSQELGFVEQEWPNPFEPPAAARTQTVPWGKYTIRIENDPLTITVVEGTKTRRQIHFDLDSANVRFPLDGPIFGLGEGTNTFDRRNTREPLINGQTPADFRTYGARVQIPLVISPTGWGIFIGQPQGTFDFTRTEGIFRGIEASSTRNVFLMLGDNPVEVLHEYAQLTGFPHMPPRWALGYMQSHRTLAGRDQVLNVAKTFRDKKLPCDAVIYLGTGFCPSGWNTGHGSFTFNNQVFPDPPAMLRELHEQHFNVVLHVVPPGNLHGRVSDTGSSAYAPGNAAAYWEQHEALERIGVDGWWPDEGDKFSVYARFDRNRMYFEGSRKSSQDRRPFALHRNGYAGIQRFGWLWSGDTACSWAALHAQIMVGIGSGLSGISYWGTDIAGFEPSPELTPELFVRWFQFAAFCPSFRGHGRTWQLRLPWGWNTGDPGPKETEAPWAATWPASEDLHRPEIEEICRKYLNLRYRLLPYIYSSVAQGHTTGLPLMRALSLNWPRDEKAVLADDAYMWGDHILVAPVYEKSATSREVYLPAGGWWDYWTATPVEGGKSITRTVDLATTPLYVTAGAILPIGPVRQYASEPVAEPVTLRIYPGADGGFTWYDDDGISYAHERGEFMRAFCTWSEATRTLTVKRDPAGRIPLPRTINVELAGSKQSRLIALQPDGATVKL
jgi:alpha-glucosidase (family GH31 glycosyl hydrolase)